jgi:carbonic anhydrase
MKPSTVVRIGTIAPLAVLSLGIVACRQPDAQPSASGAPVPGPSTATTAPAPAPASDPVWHYEGDEGPAHWGTISAKFASCLSGRAQSPIDIVAPARRATPDAIVLKFAPTSLRIVHHDHVADVVNNGHTIQVNYSEGDRLTVGGRAYQLVQYHFHAPSEHTVNGKQFPMEMHLVHTNAEGQLAVIGVLIVEGAHNAAFDPIWANLPVTKDVENHLEHVKVDVDALLPKARTTYRYEGSLTTPPCSEGVKWFVMTTPIALSKAQIGAFTALFHGNNRPVQPLNGRPVLTDEVGGTD